MYEPTAFALSLFLVAGLSNFTIVLNMCLVRCASSNAEKATFAQAFRLAATDRGIVNLRESGPVAVGLMSLWPSNCWACGRRIAGPARRHSFVGLADNFAVSVTLRRSWFGSARLAFMAYGVLFSSLRALLSCGGGARWADHMALQRAHARFGERCRQRRVQRAQLVWRSWPVM